MGNSRVLSTYRRWGMALVRISACVGLSVGSLACGGGILAPVTTPPAAISAPTVTAEQNPDVIWIVRNTEVAVVDDEGRPALRADLSKRTLSALFACYRRPVTSPGVPECYVAKYIWNA